MIHAFTDVPESVCTSSLFGRAHLVKLYVCIYIYIYKYVLCCSTLACSWLPVMCTVTHSLFLVFKYTEKYFACMYTKGVNYNVNLHLQYMCILKFHPSLIVRLQIYANTKITYYDASHTVILSRSKIIFIYTYRDND